MPSPHDLDTAPEVEPPEGLVRPLLERQVPAVSGGGGNDDDDDVQTCLNACKDLVSVIRETSGLSTDEILTIMGCDDSVRDHFELKHLRSAMRYLQDLAAATQELWDLCTDTAEVGQAFRGSDGRVRSRRSEPSWHALYVDAFTFVSDRQAPERVAIDSPDFHAALAELRAFADS